MQLGNFQVRERTERDIAHDRVYAAMETGNAAQARLYLKEFEGSGDSEGADILRRTVQKDYGIRL